MFALPGDREITDGRLWTARGIAVVLGVGALSTSTTSGGPGYLAGVVAGALIAYYLALRALSEPAE